MTTRESSPLLVVSESSQQNMITAARRAHPNETGGILLGVYLDGQPWVTTAVEIESNDRGRHHYKIPSGTTQPEVRAARKLDTRIGYLGDWHSHPSDIGPSPTDLATLTISSVKNPRTPNPTLLVVRRTALDYSFDARRIATLTPRICRLLITGDLPPELPLRE